ncbi:MAG: DUF6429 family protein [Bacillota bacterium]
MKCWNTPVIETRLANSNISCLFTALDAIALFSCTEEGLIHSNRRAKSVWLTEAGEEEARRLLVQYGLALPDHPERNERVRNVLGATFSTSCLL